MDEPTSEVMTRAVIRGRTVRDGVPIAAAYVRLLDCAGEFNDEVMSGPSGEFRFSAVIQSFRENPVPAPLPPAVRLPLSAG